MAQARRQPGSHPTTAARSEDADLVPDAWRVQNPEQLGELLRRLRRRHARRDQAPQLTVRELAGRSGYGRSAIAEYLSGRTVPPTDRLDVLIRLLGAGPAEQRALATARDRVEERRRAAGASGTAPRELPPAVPHFTGREAELAQLDTLRPDPGGRAAASAPVTVITGLAGIGKTSLAVHWAHRRAEWFPDGQLYVDLRGFGPDEPSVAPAEAARRFLAALGVPPQRVPAEPEAQVRLFHRLLAGRRMLLVLDNARDAAQVRPLLPGAGCAVLVTSRHQLAGLAVTGEARLVTLDPLPAPDARRLLAARIGRARVVAEPAAVDALVAACAGLPLALAITAARAATRTGFPLAVLAAQVREADRGLDPWTGPDPAADIRAVLSWSYRALDPAAARMFRRLSLHPGPDLAAPAAASLAAVPVRQAHRLLAELTDAHLLSEHRPGRYTLHDLLRAYAGELASATDPEPDQATARGRMLDHYLHTAYAANRRYDPHHRPIALDPPRPGTVTDPPADRDQAVAWFAAEYRVLIAAVGYAAGHGFDAHACLLPACVAMICHKHGHWHDIVATHRIALSAADRLGDQAARVRAHRGLAIAFTLLNQFDQARAHYRRSRRLSRRLRDRIGQGYDHLNLGELYEQQGDRPRAIRHAEQALALFRAAGFRAGQSRVLNALGPRYARAGDPGRGLHCCQQALAINREIGDALATPGIWRNLGYVHHRVGDVRQAIACYRRALQLFRQVDHRVGLAQVLDHLGDAHLDDRRPVAARAVWQESLAIFTQLARPEADEVRAKLGSPST